jgi:hypothetical protein
MIDSHVHLLDMKSEKVTLIKININNNTEAEVVVAPVVMAMFHLHHPTSLAISSLG